MASTLPIFKAAKIIDEDNEPCTNCSLASHWNDRTQRGEKILSVKQAPIVRYSTSESIAGPLDPVDLLIVADAPTYHDNKHERFWSDQDGVRLLDYFKEVVTESGIQSFVVIPAVRCYPCSDVNHFVLKKKYKGSSFKKSRPTGLEEAEKAVAKCKDYVVRAVNTLKPRVTVAMGPLATKALDMGSSIAGLRVLPLHPRPGLALASKREGTMVTYDRAFARTSQWARRDLLRDLREKLPNLLTTDYAFPEGDRSTIDITVLDTVAGVKKFVDHCFTSEEIPTDDFLALDFETESLELSTVTNRLLNVGFSFKSAPDSAFVIPLAHPETPFSVDELAEVYEHLKRLFQAKGARFWAFLAHNAQFETQMIKLFFDVFLGEEGNKVILDTQVIAYLMDENRKNDGISKPYSLETLASEMLGFRWYAETAMKAKRESLSQENIETVNEYVGVDASVTARLVNVQIERMEEEGSLYDLMRVAAKLYSEAIRYTSDLTMTGQGVDVDLLRKLRAPDSSIVHRLREIEEHFAKSVEVRNAMRVINQAKQSASGASPLFKSSATTVQPFSLASHDHRRALFWDVMHLDGAKESVDKAWQERYKKAEPLVAMYQEYQQLSKLDSSYLEPMATWLSKLQSADGRIRPRFNLINTTSGRLSATEPNSQQLPRGDTRDKRQIKAMFRAAMGKILVQLDFSQAEVRWLGILSGDKALAAKYALAAELQERLLQNPNDKEAKRALKVDGDIHMSTALTMYKLPMDLPFTDEKAAKLARQKAKTVCFGLIYGKNYKSLAKDLKIKDEEAQNAVDLWMAQFPEAAAWLENVDNTIEDTCLARSPFGRWRRLPEAAAPDMAVANRAKRQARNTPIQSAASDFCIYAACKLRRALRRHPDVRLRLHTKLINTVHDSLVAELPWDPETIMAYTTLARDIFTDSRLIEKDFGVVATVPLAVDFDVGVNWGAMADFDLTEKSLKRALYDAEIIRDSPTGTLFEDVIESKVLYDQAILGLPVPEKK
jgi:DNA polymerase I-like protein with 3'-5' exonuclease and polymerase domains/uracil-DNA glycosylase